MSHAYHQGLPGYVSGALFHTGCDECEGRAKQGVAAVRFMDPDRLRYAVTRAWVFETGSYASSRAFIVDDLEVDFLHDLGRVVVSFTAAGLMQPILRPVA